MGHPPYRRPSISRKLPRTPLNVSGSCRRSARISAMGRRPPLCQSQEWVETRHNPLNDFAVLQPCFCAVGSAMGNRVDSLAAVTWVRFSRQEQNQRHHCEHWRTFGAYRLFSPRVRTRIGLLHLLRFGLRTQVRAPSCRARAQSKYHFDGHHLTRHPPSFLPLKSKAGPGSRNPIKVLL
jgi:hypothetical protein